MKRPSPSYLAMVAPIVRDAETSGAIDAGSDTAGGIGRSDESGLTVA